MFKRALAMFLVIVLLGSSLGIENYAFGSQQQSKEDEKKEINIPVKVEKIRELEELRESNTKTFINSDGTFTKEIHTEDIHFEEDGELKDISNTPVTNSESDKSDFKFKNKENKFKVKFAKDTRKKNLVKIEIDKEKINLQLLNASYATPQNIDGNIIYEDILKNTDIKYSIGNSSVKEDIILKNKDSVREIQFLITGSLLPKKEGRNINFYNKKEEIVWSMPHPFMEDANGKYSEEISFDIKEEKNGYLFTMIPDSKYLEEKDTEYPVRIDPTVNLGGTSSTTLDSYVMSNYPGNNYNTTPELRTGYTTSTGSTRSYIDFTNSLPDLTGKLLVKAELKVYKWNDIGETIPTNIYANRVTGNWDKSTINWTNQPSFNTSVAYGSTSNIGNAKVLNVNVTDLVNGWLKGTFPNYGLLIRSTSEGTKGTYQKYNSSESSSNRPYLAITYSEKPNAPTATATSNQDGTGYVNLSWTKVDGATGYKVLIFNGRVYEEIDVKNVTSWSSKGKKLWPSDTHIRNKQYNLRLSGDGVELPENPNNLYKSGGGNYPNSTNYWFRIKAYNKYGTTAESHYAIPSIPDKTKPNAPTGVVISNNKFDEYTIGWQAATDPNGSGIAKYRVFLGDQPGVANILNGHETTGTSYKYTGTLQPRKTYYAWVQAIDKSGNISNNAANQAEALKPFDAEIVSMSIPSESNIDNLDGETLWFEVENKGISTWTSDQNISLTLSSFYGTETNPTGFVGTLNNGEIIKPKEKKKFYVKWYPKKNRIGTYNLKAVVGMGTTGTIINPPENLKQQSILVKDLAPPTGKLSINLGKEYTTIPNVSLDVRDVFDNVEGKKYVEFANGPKSATPESLTFTPQKEVKGSSASFDWNIGNEEGRKYVYARFKDESGNVSSVENASIVFDKTVPFIQMKNLSNGEFIKGTKKIEGTITDQDLKNFRVEYRKIGSENVTWKLINEGKSNVENGVLSQWNTASLPKGEYEIQVTAVDSAGQSVWQKFSVWVDNPGKELVGLEDYYPASPIALLSGSGFVNLYNGALNISDSDFALKARSFSIGLDRSYSSNLKDKGVLGIGWTSSFEQKLVIGGTSVDFKDEDGTIHRFNRLENGGFSVPEGTGFQLAAINGSGYELTDKNGSLLTKVFDQDGRLKKISDANGNQIDYQYDGEKLVKVSSVNKSMNFTYNSAGLLTTVTFNTGDVVQYAYENNYLTKRTTVTKSGKIADEVQYQYSAGKLSAVKYENNLQITFAYNGDRIIETKTKRSTRIIDSAKKYPTKTYDSIIDTFGYNLDTNKISVVTKSLNPDETSKNLANTDYELDTNGFLAKQHIIRTYAENEDPENAKKDTENITIETKYEKNFLKSIKDGKNQQTSYEYDSYGNVLKVNLPAVTSDGKVNSYNLQSKYNEKGQITHSYNTQGKVKQWIYDAKGNNTKIIDEEGNTQEFIYDDNGNLLKTLTDRGPVYGFIQDFSMENSGLADWKVEGKVAKVTTHSKSGKQSIQIPSSGTVQSANVPIKKGRLPVMAMIKALVPEGAATAKMAIQYVKNDTVLKEYAQTLSLSNAWKSIKVKGDVPADATHVRVKVWNTGTAAIYVDDLVFEESGLTTEYKYDEDGLNVLETKDPYGKKTTYTYNEYGQALTETNALDQTQKIVYDEEQRVQQNIDRMGRKTTYQYDTMGNVIKEVNSLGQTTAYEYNEWGQLVYTKLPAVKNTSYKNETIDKVEEVQAHLVIEYDELGREVRETDEQGNVQEQEFDRYGRLARSIDPMGNQKTFIYDKNGNIIYTQDLAVPFKEDPDDPKVERVLAFTGGMKATYDEWNRQIEESDNTVEKIGDNPSNVTMKNTYDSENRLVKTRDAEGTEIFYQYNELNENIYTYDNSIPIVQTWSHYDGLGSPAITLSGNSIEFAVTDANGNLLESIDHKGTKTTFEYNEVGDKIKQTNPDGTITTWSYNKEGQILKETQKVEDSQDTETFLITSFQYNDAGEVVLQKQTAEIRDKAADKKDTIPLRDTELSYDELGRLVREYTKNFDGATDKFKISDYRFLYDLNGNLTKKWIYDESSKTVLENGTTYPFVRSERNYEYDKNNRFILEKKIENGRETTVTYQDDKDTEIITSPSGNTLITHNQNDLAEKVVTPVSEEFLISYTASELIDKITGTRLTLDHDYGTNEKLTRIQTLKKGTPTVIFSETYTYNAEEQVQTAANAWEGQKAYTYTQEGFLKSAAKGSETLNYSYDTSGNLLKSVNQSGKVLLDNQYGQGNRISSSIQFDQALGKYKKVTYTFKPDGSLLKESISKPADTPEAAKTATVETVRDYNYDSINLLMGITTKKNGKEVERIEFTYDSEDNRSTKKVITPQGERTEFYYYDANGDLSGISEQSGIDLLVQKFNFHRDATGQLLNFKYKGKMYDYVFNHRGDVVAITDETQQVIVKYSYDEWGNLQNTEAPTPIGAEIAAANPFRYVGKYGVQYDTDTKLYFMGWRDYDPTIGRFLVADEYEGEEESPISFNRYLYAESDPVNNIDPDGYAPKWLKKIRKGVKKAAKAAFKFAIADDIKTIRNKNTKWYQKAGAAVSIASNFYPGGGFVSKSVKAAYKGTAKAVTRYKASKKVVTAKKKTTTTGKKNAAAVNKKPKTVPAPSIKRSPKTVSPAPAKVKQPAPKPKKATVKTQPPRNPVQTRMDKQQARAAEKPEKAAGKRTGNPAVDDILSNIPSNATKRTLTPTENIKEGVEYKWNDGTSTWRIRMHSEDLSAPIGSNANKGWTMRVQRGKWFMDIDGNWHKNNLLNKNSPFFDETVANKTHIPIKRP